MTDSAHNLPILNQSVAKDTSTLQAEHTPIANRFASTKPSDQTAHDSIKTAIDSQAVAQVDALYIHIPFCFHKCHYCDFYSLVDGPDRNRQPAFTQALIAELTHRKKQLTGTPKTIFFGGGTPTLLAVNLWQDLLKHMHDLGWIDPELNQEITVEANPETVSLELFRVLVEGGINRVSIGAQTFNAQHLKTLERWHDPIKVGQAVKLAQSAGIHNISLDLIFSIPGQSLADLTQDLKQALSLTPTHLSIYSLIYEPNTPITAQKNKGRIQPIEESIESQMYETVINTLNHNGFEHYEVSNYAKKTQPNQPSCYRSQHNCQYWLNHNWLGTGPGAASHLEGIRWKNQASLDRYIATTPSPPITQVEELDQDAQRGEQLMLGLRILDGVSYQKLYQWLPPENPRWQTIAYLTEIGMLETTAPTTATNSNPDHHTPANDSAPSPQSKLRLTKRGLFVADSVLAELL